MNFAFRTITKLFLIFIFYCKKILTFFIIMKKPKRFNLQKLNLTKKFDFKNVFRSKYLYLWIVLGVVILVLCLYFYQKTRKVKKWFKNKKKEINKELYELRKIEKKKKLDENQIFYLAQKYQQGIPEVLSSDGQVLPGMKPNLKKALFLYLQLLKTSYHYWVLIPIGDIYNYSDIQYPDLVDTEKAREYYSQALHSPVVNIRLEAMEKIKALNQEQNLPSMTSILELNQPIETQTDNLIFTEIRQAEPAPLPNIPEPATIPVEIRNDTQNTHDSGVVNSIKQTINRLRMKVDNPKSKTVCLLEIQQLIDNEKKNQTLKNKAFKTLKSMKNHDSFISSAGMTETEALALVWNRISILDKNNKENAERNLLLQLSEANEWGQSVCPQGRFNHVIGSLETIDEDVQIKPLWAIKQEMYNNSIKIREQLLNNYNESEKEKIEKGTDDKLVSDFEWKLNKNLRETFKKEYCPHLVSEEFIDGEIDSWNI